MKWQSNTEYICKKAFSRIWLLRRLKPLGASDKELLEVYETHIRCILEFCVPVWNSGLTKTQINQIERVQKCALANYVSYDHAL